MSAIKCEVWNVSYRASFLLRLKKFSVDAAFRWLQPKTIANIATDFS